MNNKSSGVLSNKTYRLWLTSRLLANFAKSMQTLIVAWQVYELTKSPLALGFIGLAEALPFVLVGLWAGHAADRYEKKNQIAFSIGGLFLCSTGLFILSLSATPAVLPIYAVLGVTGFLASFEFSSSSAYVQTIFSTEEFHKAAAWNLSQYQVTIILGPLAGGWVLSQAGVPPAYALSALFFFMSFIVASRLPRLESVLVGPSATGLESIKTGIKFLLTKRVIVACMALDMFAVLFGDVIALLPIFASLFAVGPLGLGLLRASPAIGSLALSLAQANRPFLHINWKSFLTTVAVFGFCMIGFGLSKVFWVSVFFLIASGAADAVSVIIRQSIYQANTPDHLRGRVTSVSSIFIRLSNEMGAFESGLAAHWMGAVPSVLFGGFMTLASVLFMGIKYRNLKNEA